MKTYAFRVNHGIKASDLTAQDIGEALTSIENRYGVIEPPRVVKESRPEDAPLHPLFDWDDEKAAEKWRLEQARRVVRSVEVVVNTDPPQLNEIGFVNIPSLGGYVSGQRVARDADLFGEALHLFTSRVEAAQFQLERLELMAPYGQQSQFTEAHALLAEALKLVRPHT